MCCNNNKKKKGSSSSTSSRILATNVVLTVLLLLLLQGRLTPSVQAVATVEFSNDQVMPEDNLVSFDFVSRITVPYGPDLYPDDGTGKSPQKGTEQPYRGYGYGMGTMEEMSYDHVNHYLYAASNAGYVMIIDYADPRRPFVTNYSFDITHLDSEVGAVEVCSETGRLLLNMKDLRRLDIYEAVQRGAARTPTLLRSVDVGGRPRTVLPNKACTAVAIANENSGKDTEQGSVTMVRGIDTDDPQTNVIPLDSNKGWDDNYFINKGLHMPLTRNALQYWDTKSHLAADENFTNVIQNYASPVFIEPKKMAWGGPDEDELLVNLQENNGLLRINVTENRVMAAASYGLKDHAVVPVDINSSDKQCVLQTYKDLFALRSPDGITTIKYNDIMYVVIANEGDFKAYGETFEDSFEAQTLFKGGEFGLKGIKVDPEIFDPVDFTVGSAALFNEKCVGPDCVQDIELAVGSSAIDFESDPSNPVFHRMVMFGGRGWSIFELPQDPDSLLKLVFDSAASFEGVGCEVFPWAHNSIQDEEMAPTTNLTNNTLYQQALAQEDDKLLAALTEMNDPAQDGCVDQGDGRPGACPMSQLVDAESSSEGAGVEQVVTGIACGRLVAALATEKASIAFLFDITDITSPIIIKAFHLSPASQYKSAPLAYNDGEVGEIDPENSVFLTAEQSPSGKPAIIFGGAWSGTASFWEFDCGEMPPANGANGGSGSDRLELPITWVTVALGMAVTLTTIIV